MERTGTLIPGLSLKKSIADLLSLAAAKLPAYKKLIDVAVDFGKQKGG